MLDLARCACPGHFEFVLPRLRDEGVAAHAQLRDPIEFPALDHREKHQAGQDEDEHRKHLDQSAKQRTGAGVIFILCPENALNDGLVRAPVPNAQGRVPQGNGIPRHGGFLGRGAQDRHLDEVMARLQLRDHAAPSAHLPIGEHGNDQGAGEQDHRLDRLGQHHGGKTAQDGVNRRQ